MKCENCEKDLHPFPEVAIQRGKLDKLIIYEDGVNSFGKYFCSEECFIDHFEVKIEATVSEGYEQKRRDGIDDCYTTFTIDKRHQFSEKPEASYENYDLTVYNMAEMIGWLKVRLRKAHERIDELEEHEPRRSV